MKKVRISCDVTLKLRQHLDAQAKENGISRAKFIETAVQDKIEGFNVHKEKTSDSPKPTPRQSGTS